MSDGTTKMLGHLFYAHGRTYSASCQGYAGLHFQFGTVVFGVMPWPWKDRGGLSLRCRVGIPPHGQRPAHRHEFSARWWPKGGPNGEIAKRQRAKRTRDPNLGYSPPKAQQANCPDKADEAS